MMQKRTRNGIKWLIGSLILLFGMAFMLMPSNIMKVYAEDSKTVTLTKVECIVSSFSCPNVSMTDAKTAAQNTLDSSTSAYVIYSYNESSKTCQCIYWEGEFKTAGGWSLDDINSQIEENYYVYVIGLYTPGYSVTYHEGEVTSSDEDKYATGTIVTLKTPTSIQGKFFKGWSYEEDGDIITTSTITIGNANVDLYENWGNIIDEQPSQTNGYTVKVDSALSSDATYQWYVKEDVAATFSYDYIDLSESVFVGVDLSNGVHSGTTWSIISLCFNSTSPIELGAKLRFMTEATDLNVLDFNGDGETKVGSLEKKDNGYYEFTFGQFSIMSIESKNGEFTITNFELTLPYKELDNQTSASLDTTSLTSGSYKCVVTSLEKNCSASTYVDIHVHSYGEVEYSWNTSNTKCTATKVCTQDGSHIVTETVDVVANVVLYIS